MRKPTTEERQTALVHATALERASQAAIKDAGSHAGIDQNVMRTLGWFAKILGSEYRHIANGSSDLED